MAPPLGSSRGPRRRAIRPGSSGLSNSSNNINSLPIPGPTLPSGADEFTRIINNTAGIGIINSVGNNTHSVGGAARVQDDDDDGRRQDIWRRSQASLPRYDHSIETERFEEEVILDDDESVQEESESESEENDGLSSDLGWGPVDDSDDDEAEESDSEREEEIDEEYDDINLETYEMRGTSVVSLLRLARTNRAAAHLVDTLGGRQHLLRHGRWPGDVPQGWEPPLHMWRPGPYERGVPPRDEDVEDDEDEENEDEDRVRGGGARDDFAIPRARGGDGRGGAGGFHTGGGGRGGGEPWGPRYPPDASVTLRLWSVAQWGLRQSFATVGALMGRNFGMRLHPFGSIGGGGGGGGGGGVGVEGNNNNRPRVVRLDPRTQWLRKVRTAAEGLCGASDLRTAKAAAVIGAHMGVATGALAVASHALRASEDTASSSSSSSSSDSLSLFSVAGVWSYLRLPTDGLAETIWMAALFGLPITLIVVKIFVALFGENWSKIGGSTNTLRRVRVTLFFALLAHALMSYVVLASSFLFFFEPRDLKEQDHLGSERGAVGGTGVGTGVGVAGGGYSRTLRARASSTLSALSGGGGGTDVGFASAAWASMFAFEKRVRDATIDSVASSFIYHSNSNPSPPNGATDDGGGAGFIDAAAAPTTTAATTTTTLGVLPLLPPWDFVIAAASHMARAASHVVVEISRGILWTLEWAMTAVFASLWAMGAVPYWVLHVGDPEVSLRYFKDTQMHRAVLASFGFSHIFAALFWLVAGARWPCPRVAFVLHTALAAEMWIIAGVLARRNYRAMRHRRAGMRDCLVASVAHAWRRLNEPCKLRVDTPSFVADPMGRFVFMNGNNPYSTMEPVAAKEFVAHGVFGTLVFLAVCIQVFRSR